MTGTLQIDTAPEGADIYLDGVNTNLISPTSFILTAGIHNYIVSLNSYISISGSVDVFEGQYTYLVVTLEQESLVLYKQLITLTAIGVGISAIAILFRRK